MKNWVIYLVLIAAAVYMIYRYNQYKTCMKVITNSDGTIDKTKKCSFSLTKDTSIPILV